MGASRSPTSHPTACAARVLCASKQVRILACGAVSSRHLHADARGDRHPGPEHYAEADTTFGTYQPVQTLGPSITPRPTPVPTYPPNPHRITFLVTGVDYMQGRAHYSMDTLMVVSFETRTKKVSMISIPRDSANFEYYWGGQAPVTVRINTFYSRVKSGLIKAPDTPWVALKKEIGFLVGIPVDYFAAMDIDGFPALVDLVGGVDVINPKPIHDPFSHTELPAGPIHLDGVTAIHYVRSRHGAGDSDYTRSARQQDVLVALERKITSPEMVLKDYVSNFVFWPS